MFFPSIVIKSVTFSFFRKFDFKKDLISLLTFLCFDRSYPDWTFGLYGSVLQLSWLHLQVAVALYLAAFYFGGDFKSVKISAARYSL